MRAKRKETQLDDKENTLFLVLRPETYFSCGLFGRGAAGVLRETGSSQPGHCATVPSRKGKSTEMLVTCM